MLKKEPEICGRNKIDKPSYMDLMYFYVQVNHDYKKALKTTEEFLENRKIDMSYYELLLYIYLGDLTNIKDSGSGKYRKLLYKQVDECFTKVVKLILENPKIKNSKIANDCFDEIANYHVLRKKGVIETEFIKSIEDLQNPEFTSIFYKSLFYYLTTETKDWKKASEIMEKILPQQKDEDFYLALFKLYGLKYNDILNKESSESIELTLQDIDKAIEDYNKYINKTYPPEILSNMDDYKEIKEFAIERCQGRIYSVYYELLDFYIKKANEYGKAIKLNDYLIEKRVNLFEYEEDKRNLATCYLGLIKEQRDIDGNPLTPELEYKYFEKVKELHEFFKDDETNVLKFLLLSERKFKKKGREFGILSSGQSNDYEYDSDNDCEGVTYEEDSDEDSDNNNYYDYKYVALYKEIMPKQQETINNIFKKLSNEDKLNDELTSLAVDVYVTNSSEIPDQSIKNIGGENGKEFYHRLIEFYKNNKRYEKAIACCKIAGRNINFNKQQKDEFKKLELACKELSTEEKSRKNKPYKKSRL